MPAGSARFAVLSAGMLAACLAVGYAVAVGTSPSNRVRRSLLVGIVFAAVSALIVIVATGGIIVVRHYFPTGRQDVYQWHSWESLAAEIEVGVTLFLLGISFAPQSPRLRTYVLDVLGLLAGALPCLLVVALSFLLFYGVLERLPF